MGDLPMTATKDVTMRGPNYDESKIGPYALEDPLAFFDGRKLESVEDWPARRAEILDVFAREMYGAEPPRPDAVVTEMFDESATCGGLGIRRQYHMWFREDKSGPCIDWVVFIPNRIAGDVPQKKADRMVCENKRKTPVVLFLNYDGNPSIEDKWRKTEHRYQFPLETILARGYAVMSASYQDVSPDPGGEDAEESRARQDAHAYTKVFSLWGPRDPARTDNIASLGAWAWALSRGLDLAERIPEVDATKSVATGCSRLGKTALLAAARDERFAVCAPIQTGGGGAPLAKRDFGENVSTETRMFTHWFCRAYAKYAGNEQAMAFDQHLLLASIAPRALLVLGFNNPWFDTKGEFLACRAASPAWEFFGEDGLPPGDWPENWDVSRIGRKLGYVRRGGAHGMAGDDWNWILNFADGVFLPTAP
jgi:hypothetical protein